MLCQRQVRPRWAVLENAAGDTVLSSFDDGGLLVSGQFDTGTIPAEGAGVRMMWHPAKAAFRAGSTSGTEWDEANVGDYSMAFGYSTTASGEYSNAFGFNARATKMGATAFGNSTQSSGVFSTAFGEYANASGILSTAFGALTYAKGNGSTAFGSYTETSGFLATAFGQGTMATGDHSTAFGFYTVASTPNSLSFDSYNLSNTISDNTLFVIGNGENFENKSDAFRVNESGDVFANSINTSSDQRIKENIHSLEDHTLQKLAKIHPVRHQFKDQQTKPTGDQIGLIAQEVRMQFPELVSEGSDGFLSLSYSNFTAVLLKGIQEQQAQIQDLRKQLEEKDRQMKQLRARADLIDQLNERLSRLEQQSQNGSSADAE